MNGKLASLLLILVTLCTSCQSQKGKKVVLDETNYVEVLEQSIEIDSVWAGHPVNFCLYTHEDRQYITYYNSTRNMVVGQRNLEDDKFELYILPPTDRETSGGTSTVIGWDSHNYLTIAIDKDGFIHFSGNMHVHPMTYFKTTKPHDISTLVQKKVLVGTNEQRCTYPKFLLTKEGELLFHYRDGGSGNGNEIYNSYSTETKKWTRMLDVPLTDGQGLMNAYQSQPTLREDGWYHLYWVWRDTPDCSTNHDLSYMKSPDLKNWFSAFGDKIELPATLDQKALIVDPIPVKGGIINLAAKLCLDDQNKPVFTYHKYDNAGNIQLYVASIIGDEWNHQQITDWDYRWEFSGNGSVDVEVRIKAFTKRNAGLYEIDYWHMKYGDGTILLNDKLENIGKVLKPSSFQLSLAREGTFPGLKVKTVGDSGEAVAEGSKYVLKWETLERNRDKPREKPWPNASKLHLYKVAKKKG